MQLGQALSSTTQQMQDIDYSDHQPINYRDHSHIVPPTATRLLAAKKNLHACRKGTIGITGMTRKTVYPEIVITCCERNAIRMGSLPSEKRRSTESAKRFSSIIWRVFRYWRYGIPPRARVDVIPMPAPLRYAKHKRFQFATAPARRSTLLGTYLASR